MAWDGESKGRGGSKWRAKRKRVFERDNFLCRICKRNGKLTPVELHGKNHGVCDHINALADGGHDDEDNLQCICQDCNKIKTQHESASSRGVVKKMFSNEVGIDGWPIDVNHPANQKNQ